MIYTNKGRRKEDREPFNTGLAFDNEKLKRALADSEAELKRIMDLVAQHNMWCEDICGDKSACGFKGYDRHCGNCHKDYMINLTHPAK